MKDKPVDDEDPDHDHFRYEPAAVDVGRGFQREQQQTARAENGYTDPDRPAQVLELIRWEGSASEHAPQYDQVTYGRAAQTKCQANQVHGDQGSEEHGFSPYGGGISLTTDLLRTVITPPLWVAYQT